MKRASMADGSYRAVTDHTHACMDRIDRIEAPIGHLEALRFDIHVNPGRPSYLETTYGNQ
jgi:hypothetical protein